MSQKASKELKVILGYLTTEDLNQAITALQNTSLHIVDVAENGTELVRRAIELEADALIYPADLPGLEGRCVRDALFELQDAEGNGIPMVILDAQHPAVGEWLDPFLHAYRKFIRAQGVFERLLKRYHIPLVTLTGEAYWEWDEDDDEEECSDLADENAGFPPELEDESPESA